ncbi:MAG: hypothetical protein K0S25_1977, partial [Bacillus sp. (in: firmicutes)]|nr:hypothetical protein [Bacillus sp. (in: firmicutes)]
NNNNNNQKNGQQNNNQNNDQQNNNQNTVVYYQARHVKSISEDSKTNSTQVTETNEDTVEFFEADNFSQLLNHLLKETIQINQGGPESKYGTLLGVANGFVILYTEDDGIVYFNIDHVKSVSKYQTNDDNDNDNNNNNNQNNNQQIITYPEFLEAENFHGVFSHMAHKWVSINRGGPEAMEGVLVENAGGHYTLVSNEEVLRIHPYHIRSISSGPKGSLSQNNQNDNSEENQSNDQSTQNSNNAKNEKNENKNKNKEKESRKTSRRSESKEYQREKVVKTIDYVWKGSK